MNVVSECSVTMCSDCLRVLVKLRDAKGCLMVLHMFDCSVHVFEMFGYVFTIRSSSSLCYFEISNTISGLVFDSHASFILKKANLLHPTSDGICSILPIEKS